MKKTIIWILVITAVIFIPILVFGPGDNCVDRGGVWDSKQKMCIQTEEEATAIRLQKISSGMTVDKVVSVMGTPMYIKDIPSSSSDSRFLYSYVYKAPLGSSGDFEIIFYKDTNTVRSIYKGD